MHKKFMYVFSNFWGFKIGVDAKNSYLHTVMPFSKLGH